MLYMKKDVVKETIKLLENNDIMYRGTIITKPKPIFDKEGHVMGYDTKRPDFKGNLTIKDISKINIVEKIDNSDMQGIRFDNAKDIFGGRPDLERYTDNYITYNNVKGTIFIELYSDDEDTKKVLRVTLNPEDENYKQFYDLIPGVKNTFDDTIYVCLDCDKEFEKPLSGNLCPYCHSGDIVHEDEEETLEETKSSNESKEAIMDRYIKRLNDLESYNYDTALEELNNIKTEIESDDTLDYRDKNWLNNLIIKPLSRRRFNIG